jgi:hypothetical protein
MSTAAPLAAAGRRSRRWWYVLAIGVVVVLVAMGTLLTLRLHPFGIGASVTVAPKQHTAERSASTEKTPTEKPAGADRASTDKSGAADKAASGAKPREKATPTPGA